MPHISKQEKLLQQAIRRAENELFKIYERSILEISMVAGGTRLRDKPFSLSLYPLIEKEIVSQMDKMHLKIYNEIVKSVMQSWDLSNRANDVLVDKRLAGKSATSKAKQILYDANSNALNSFLSRKEKGLNLSERVWNTLEPFRSEMEQALGISIAKGKSAAKMATEIKQYLNQPDKLFRRVRSEAGKLALSKAAQNYHPGKGVYRSSYKNALRLTSTETNIAYRTADHERWKQLPFVIGIRIHTSKNHPLFDICDELGGDKLYPKDFVFTGFHPFCRCYATPEMMNDDDYNKLEDDILSGKQVSTPKSLLVSEPPKAFTKYISGNKKRIAGWKTKPYWYSRNKKYVKESG